VQKAHKIAGSKQLVQRQSRKAKREEQILRAAFEEFAANGYAAARLDDVARRAKIAKGTIFLHFRDKKSLFRAVLRNLVHPARPILEPQPQIPSVENEHVLRDLLSRQYIEVVGNKKARALFRLMIAESEKFPELARIYWQEIIQPSAATLGQALQKGIPSGKFCAGDTGRFPQLLVSPAIFAVVWMLLLGNRHGLDLDAYKEAHLDFVMRGLRPAAQTNAPQEPSSLQMGGQP